ncbi:MAG: hypothetical protein IJ975_04030 [Clostridia bacterium]|nr:hypothetical protein [Clostridia bacterium]
MKKIIAPLLGVALLVPFATACTPSDEHKEIYKIWNEFKTEVGIPQFLHGEIDFSSAIDAQKAQPSSPYFTLNYCEELIQISLENIDKFSGLFEITPDYNKNAIHKYCTSIEKNLNNFKNQIEVFEEEKARFEEIVATFQDTNSSAALAELDDFMLDISALTVKANALQVSFTNAFAALYALPIERDTAGGELDVKSAACQIQSRLIDDCVDYAITKHGGRHADETTTLYNSLIIFSNVIKTQTNVTTDYMTWLESYRLFANEEKMFQKSLKHVDLTKDNSNLTGKTLQHFEKVKNFVNTNASLFINKTIELLY